MVPYPKMSSKGRTELQINLSGAKNVKEAAGNVRFGAAPPKSVQNDEKPKKKSEKKFRKKFRKKSFVAEQSKVANRLKRVFPKFGGCAGHVWGQYCAAKRSEPSNLVLIKI